MHEHAYKPVPTVVARQPHGEFHDEFVARVSMCACGDRRPTRRMPKTHYILRTGGGGVPPLVEIRAAHKDLAAVLSRRWREDAEWIPTKTLLRGKGGQTDWELQQALLDLCRLNLVRVKLTPAERPTNVAVLDPEALDEIAHPGQLREIAAARETALKLVAAGEGERCRRVEQLLAQRPPPGWGAEAILAAAAVAMHASRGRMLPVRVVSAQAFGRRQHKGSASKIIERYRARIEAFFGSTFEDLGLRPHAPMATIGGKGNLVGLAGLRLDEHSPYLAVPLSRLDRIDHVEFPPGGLLLVENRNVFEAVCLGEVPTMRDRLTLDSGGSLGRAERWFVEQAHKAAAPIVCWFDMDGEGLEAARHVHIWTDGRATAPSMTVEAVQRAAFVEPFETPAKRRAIERVANAGGFLSDTASELLLRNGWIEQETQLGTSESTENGP